MMALKSASSCIDRIHFCECRLQENHRETYLLVHKNIDVSVKTIKRSYEVTQNKDTT